MQKLKTYNKYRFYTKVEVSMDGIYWPSDAVARLINAIATETAVYNALLQWHAFQTNFD